MLRSLFLALFLVLLSAVATGRAHAQTVYTPDSLSALMLTSSDVSGIVDGLGQSFTGSADDDPTADPVGVGRTFTADDGSLLYTSLFSLADGSAPSGSMRDGILNGDFLRATLDGVFDSISEWNPDGANLGGSEANVGAGFVGVIDGATYHVFADAFVHGNVFGVVFYAATGNPDYFITVRAVRGQIGKLP